MNSLQDFLVVLRKHGIPFFLLLASGLYFITFNIFGNELAFIPGDLGDARFNLYILEHNFKYFILGEAPTQGYWNAPFMYPQESIITFSDNLLGTFPIYSIFRIAGLDKYASFQWWYVVLIILNYLCSYLFLFWLTKDKYSAALGAFVFTFSIALFGQLAHAQTYARFPIPLAFLFAIKFIKSLNTRHLLIVLILLVYQFYCALYLGFLLFIPIAILLCSVFLKKEFYLKLRELKWIGSSILYLFSCILLLLPLATAYGNSPARLEAEGVQSYYDFEIIAENIPSLYSYIFLDTLSIFWSSLTELKFHFERWWEHQLFSGITVAFAVLAVFSWILYARFYRKKKLEIWKVGLFLSALVTFFLFLRIGDYTLYKFVYKLPGFYAIRAVQRIINIELIFLSAAVTIGSHLLLRRFKYQWVLFIGIATLLVMDNYVVPWTYPSYKIETSKHRIEKLKAQMTYFEKGSIVSFESIEKLESFHLDHIDAMLACQETGMISINGYSSKCAIGFCEYYTHPNSENRSIWLMLKENSSDIRVIQLGTN